MTIVEAEKIILSDVNKPMKTKELVNKIESRGLFKFGAKQPESVLSGTLRKKAELFEKTDAGLQLK